MKKAAIVILVTCFGIVGCTQPIIPTKVPLESHTLSPISSKKPITLINEQDDKIVSILYSDPVTFKMETNFHNWTNQALVLIRQWLNKYKVPIGENSQKALKVSISNAKMKERRLAGPGFFLTCTTLTLNVETGNGIKKSFPVDMCAGGLNRSAGYAINLAVIELMHDYDILRYIGDK